MNEQQWCDVLNRHVFFWLHPAKLATLLGARRYRSSFHDVLTVDTASLLRDYIDRVRLSAINSGSTLYPNAPTRGGQTFQQIEDYPFDQRRRRGLEESIVELAIVDGVPDIHKYIMFVERRRMDEIAETLFAR